MEYRALFSYIAEGQDRDVVGVAGAHEAARLARGVDVEHAGDVVGLVADAFSSIRGVHNAEARRFVEEFAASRALAEGEDDFAEYLWEYGPDDAHWALSVLETMLDNRHPVEPLRRGGEELVRLVLRLYTDLTADAAIKSRVMDAFDRLMERYTYEAQRALEEWDRR